MRGGEDDLLGGQLLGHLGGHAAQDEVLGLDDRADRVGPQRQRVEMAVAHEASSSVRRGRQPRTRGEPSSARASAFGRLCAGAVREHGRDLILDPPPVPGRRHRANDHATRPDEPGEDRQHDRQVIPGRREDRGVERSPADQRDRSPARAIRLRSAMIDALDVASLPARPRCRPRTSSRVRAGRQQLLEVRPGPALALLAEDVIVGEPVALGRCRRVVLEGHPLVAGVVEDLLRRPTSRGRCRSARSVSTLSDTAFAPPWGRGRTATRFVRTRRKCRIVCRGRCRRPRSPSDPVPVGVPLGPCREARA